MKFVGSIGLALSVIYFGLFVASNSWADSYIPGPDLLGSPALLGDYVGWARDYDAFHAPDSEMGAYSDLVSIVYDWEIQRPWGADYFPEAQQRLNKFRAQLCTALQAPLSRVCSLPVKMAQKSDVADLEASLMEPALFGRLENRWGFRIAPVKLPGSSQSFSLEIGRGSRESAPVSFWDMTPGRITWFTMVPAVTDADSYLAGFDGDDYPSQFASSSDFEDEVILNDWLIRLRAMSFAANWKFNVEFDADNPATDPVVDSEALQDVALFKESKALFDASYADLFKLVEGQPKFRDRFLKERAKGNYPEEVYQYVAYGMLDELVHQQSAYYQLAAKQRTKLSARQKALESLLTLQRYSQNPRIFLLELETLSMIFGSHAAVLDETANLPLVMAFEFEQLNAILGVGSYASLGLYKNYRYAVLAPELFNANYLQQNQPALYKELLQADGKLADVTRMDDANQLRILKAYLVGADGKQNLTGNLRMGSLLRTRIQAPDLRKLAEIVHSAHYGAGTPY